MSDGYHPPRFGVIFLGLFLSAALLVVFLALPMVVKSVGFGLLWLPARLGIVQQVHPQDVITFVMADEPLVVQFPRGGYYVFYVRDPDLLETTDALMELNNPPWLTVLAADGSRIPVEFIKRGMLPFDSPFAAGRPVYRFLIPRSGDYTLKMPRKLVETDIVPDVVGGREGVLWLVLLMELGLLGGLAAIPIVRARHRQTERVQEVKRLKTVKGDEFWASAREKKHKPKR